MHNLFLVFMVGLLGIPVIDAHCSILGYPCQSVGSLQGICVPLDEHGQSQDCENTYGFLDPVNTNSCEEAYGSNFTNVLHHRVALAKFSLGAALRSLATRTEDTALQGLTRNPTMEQHVIRMTPTMMLPAMYSRVMRSLNYA
jgi:hypothetical protein